MYFFPMQICYARASSAKSVLRVIGRHNGNGLLEVRAEARDQMVAHLQSVDAVTQTGRIKWNVLLNLVMTQ